LASDANTLLSYGKSNGWLDDQPAVVTRGYGKGRITYIAAVLDEKLMAAAAEWMVQDSGVEPIFGPVPNGVEVSRRRGDGKDVFILINTSQEVRNVALPHSMRLLLGSKDAGEAYLGPYGVEVLVDARR
jgi:beta-galactosidase